MHHHRSGSRGSAQGIVVKDVHDVENAVDPRISVSEVPTLDEVDQTIDEKNEFSRGRSEGDKISNSPTSTKHAEKLSGPHYIDFEEGDERNPMHFSRRKKWTITLMASTFTIMASAAAGSYNMGFPSMIRDLNCTEFQATIGLAVYPLGFGVVPLITASFSEEFGRQPLYIVSALGFTMMLLLIALAKNIQTVIIARVILGAFGSTGATMVGGTIADVWGPHERGLPMAIFSMGAIGGTGLGPVIGGWIEMNPHLQWRWIQWVQMIYSAVYLLFVPFVLKETRTAILLTRIAKKLRKETGDSRYRARVEDERTSLKTLIYISCTRPIYLLLTEPIVMAFSLWIGFAWGVIYCVIESMASVFRTLHNFNQGEIGTSFVSMVVGTILGFMTIRYQETLYQKYFPKRGIEARLYAACFAAVLLPVGIFIYAWSSFPWVHWIALIIGIVLFMWATFLIYHSVFTYLADCYGPFASSALAAQSLFRNLMATAFPLFTHQMFAALTYKWASTMFALISVVLLPVPYILFFYGPSIRARSKFSRAVMATQVKLS